MNFAEAFQNFVSKITGQTERLETITNSLTDALKSLGATSDENARLKTENQTLTDRLAAAPSPESVQELTRERDGLKNAIEKDGHFSIAKDEAGSASLSFTDAGKAHFVNPEVSRVLANSGHAPLDVAVDSQAPGNTGAPAKDPKLTGRDRMAAAFKPQVAAITAKK